jgi:hypothetical protein
MNEPHNCTQYFLFGATAPSGPGPPHSRGFLSTHDTPQSVGLPWTSDQLVTETYLTTHNTHDRQTSMPPVGFKPKISADELPQTYAFRTATRTQYNYLVNKKHKPLNKLMQTNKVVYKES